jgi:predicted anti-sigma-YlaC factor YlaD
MACRRIRRAVFFWVDRRHGETIADPVGRHLDECPQCRDRATEIERLILLVRSRCPRQSAPSRLHEQILSLLDRQ